MAIDGALLTQLNASSPAVAWEALVSHALTICSKPLTAKGSASEVTRRDREVGALDLFLSTCGWDLWPHFDKSVPRTSDRLIAWWKQPHSAKAVLILDGLSLRELPWLLQGAQARGYTVHAGDATASELPGETTEFAQALGFAQRSSLQNNGGGKSHRLAPARTECVGLPWADCAMLIDAQPNWIFWHEWPDNKVHDLSGAGQGLDVLAKDAAEQLSSDGFWGLVERLATGRRLIITSDHGYAATGLFADVPEDQAKALKDIFKSGRAAAGTANPGPWIPPVMMAFPTPHGEHAFALGRRKWRSQGGYPTLAHGGLSLLEVLSPYVELSMGGAA